MKQLLYCRVLLLGIVILFFNELETFPQTTPDKNHTIVYWAELLVKHTNSGTTDYRHKNIAVTWQGINGATGYESFADCSGFINAILQQNYDWDDAYFKQWLGKSRPLAYNYYDAIAAQHHFAIIKNVSDLQPGDLLAIKYNNRDKHDDNTGHVLLVVNTAKHRQASALIESGMEQYDVTIEDASKSPHGKSDTRYDRNGKPYPGVGQGSFRLYADGQGIIKGFSWSDERPKKDFDPFANPIIAGRIVE